MKSRGSRSLDGIKSQKNSDNSYVKANNSKLDSEIKDTDINNPTKPNTDSPSTSEKDDVDKLSLDDLDSVDISRFEIDESMRYIDNTYKKRKGKYHGSKRHGKIKRHTVVKFLVILVLIIFISVIGFIGIKAIIAGGKVFDGGIFGLMHHEPLKTDSHGRSNVLIFGTSEDDEGGKHPGGELTDSIMIASIDQEKHDVYLISVPRDLWVKLDHKCKVGKQAKINTVYMCASNDGKDEDAGSEALMDKVSSIFGLDIQYFAHLNYTAVSDLINAVGGVDVKIESSDPRGIYDPNFDWTCDHKCHLVDYKNGEIAHLDGRHALALARARNAAGGYGLPRANFDREKNQRKILKALQKKAMSLGTLTSVTKVANLIDSLGDNLRTNFDTKELNSLVSLAREVGDDDIHSISLVDESDPVVKTGSRYGQSIVLPEKGLFKYSGIAKYVDKHIKGDTIKSENAGVAVINGSSLSGKSQKLADKLRGKGFRITSVDNTVDGVHDKTKIYQIKDGYSVTKNKLQKYLKVDATKGKPEIFVPDDTIFVVVIGNDN